MGSVVDEKRRVIIPKPLAEALELKKGTAVEFRRTRNVILMRKIDKLRDTLEEVISWNPRRTSKPKPISEEEMKEIWL